MLSTVQLHCGVSGSDSTIRTYVGD